MIDKKLNMLIIRARWQLYELKQELKEVEKLTRIGTKGL